MGNLNLKVSFFHSITQRIFFHIAMIIVENLHFDLYLYRPQRSCGPGNIFTPVCHSVHRGVFASVHTGTPHPHIPQSRHTPPPEQTPRRSRHPAGADTPQEQTHPPGAGRHPLGADTPQSRHPPGSILRHTVNQRPVRILLECILVW